MYTCTYIQGISPLVTANLYVASFVYRYVDKMMWAMRASVLLFSGNEVSMATLNDLLDLLCAYNSTDLPAQLEDEENIYLSELSQQRTKRFTPTWK